MSTAPIIGFVLIALLAIAFAVVPLLRMNNKKRRALLLAAIALAMLGRVREAGVASALFSHS